jgi:hypothetical protein
MSSILNLGLKFSPVLFNNHVDAFINNVVNFDDNLFKLNRDLFINKMKILKSTSCNNDYNIITPITTHTNKNNDNKNMNNKKIIYFENLTQNIKRKPKFVPTNLNLLDEIIDLRYEIFNELSTIKQEASENLSSYQIFVLKKFLREKPFKIIQCDKNIGTAFISESLHDQLIIEHLSDSNTYKELKADPLPTTCGVIETTINYLIKESLICKKLGKKLLPQKCKNGNFRILAKLHKTKFGIRPIINSIDHPTSALCQLIESILKPIVASIETVLRDSQQLLQKCETLRLNHADIYLYSCDFESLYTNIRKEDAVNIITDFVKEFLNDKYITASGFSHILRLIFENNVFVFKNKHYIQSVGIAMGCICGPSLANVFVYLLEKNWISVHRPLIYFRFIDDIFIADSNELDCNLFQNEFLNLKINIVTGKYVNFLDLIISYDKIIGKLLFSLYVKPTGTAGYLLASSNHPKWIFDNIPKSVLIRLRRNCSSLIDFYFHARNVIFQLLKQNYEKSKLLPLMYQIGNIDRLKLIPYKEKIKNVLTNTIWFNVEFNKNSALFSKIIQNKFDLFKCKYEWMKSIDFKVYNSISPNLGALCMFGFKLNLPPNYYSYPCGYLNCRVCNLMFKESFYYLKNGFCLPILSNATCESTNCIYIIKCTRCSLFYVGQTKQKIKLRINQHLSTIKKFRPYINPTTEVGLHFNLKYHSKDDLQISIFRCNIEDINKRLNIEADLINLIDKFNGPIINAIKPKLNNLKNLTFSLD